MLGLFWSLHDPQSAACSGCCAAATPWASRDHMNDPSILNRPTALEAILFARDNDWAAVRGIIDGPSARSHARV
jgi:hypothetical protein